MALRVSTIHGLSSTYLESVHASSGDTSPSPVSMMYRRTGNPSAPVECVTSDGAGLYERAMIEMKHDCLSCLVRERYAASMIADSGRTPSSHFPRVLIRVPSLNLLRFSKRTTHPDSR